MRTAIALFAFVAIATLCGAGFSGCGSSPRIIVDMKQGDMALFFPGCDNNAIDSGESDVDCGGPCEKKCAENQMCKSKSDCATGVCVLGTCVSATICSDNITNGDETDLDCGGSCPPCGFGKTCTKPADCASLMCASGMCAPLKAGITAGKSLLIGIGPLNVDVGDFDGDGKADLAALSGQDPDDMQKALGIALGKGDGTFNKPFYITGVPAAEGPFTLAVGDLDKDGKSDIVYTNAGNIIVLLNDTNAMTPAGTVAFKKPVVSGGIGSEPGRPQLIDLDGDGKLELLHCDTSYDSLANGHNVYISAYQEGGKWKVLRKLFTADDMPISPFVADFNDDRFPDVAVIAGGTIKVFLQKGDMPNTVNTFLPAKTSMTGMLTPSQIVAAELDNPPDFRVDVVVLDRNAAAYGVMAGVGDGTMLKPSKIMIPNGPAMMGLTDYDIDGKWDVATANYDTDTGGVLLGQGNRTFMQGPVASANVSPTYLAVRDVNGDRKPDLITANPGSDMVVILLNKSQ